MYEISFVLSRSNVLTHCEQYEVESLRADLEKSNSDLADAQNLLSSKVEAGKAEQELIEKAKGFNRDGKYKRAVAALDEAYSIQPKVSTAISAANLRLKLGDHAMAIAAYRKVLAAEGQAGGPAARRSHSTREGRSRA